MVYASQLSFFFLYECFFLMSELRAIPMGRRANGGCLDAMRCIDSCCRAGVTWRNNDVGVEEATCINLPDHGLVRCSFVMKVVIWMSHVV